MRNLSLQKALFFTFVAICFTFGSFVVGIRWLGIHQILENNPLLSQLDCPISREERKNFGLVNYQILLCKRLPELMPSILIAAKDSIDICQDAFADRRWNCSSIVRAPQLGTELTIGTKEQAFVYALSSAAIAWHVAKRCASGEIPNCPCGYGSDATLVKRSSVPSAISPPAIDSMANPKGIYGEFPGFAEAAYKWKGCSDNVVYGRKVSRQWADAMWRSKNSAMRTVNQKQEKMKRSSKRRRLSSTKKWENLWEFWGKSNEGVDKQIDKRQAPSSAKNVARIQMGILNNELGRELIEKELVRKCKCHGVSASCNVQTCWYSLPPLREIALKLKRKYDEAEYLVDEETQNREHGSSHPVRRWQPPNEWSPRGDGLPNMVYIRPSPNYCDDNSVFGTPGTSMRECNASIRDGPTSCESLCCGRGYNTKQVRVIEQCHCRFIYCCHVKCEKCERMVDQHICK